jgi:hypothetical protein
MANGHAHPVALLRMSSLRKSSSPPGVFCDTTARLGPPVVLHELIAVATHPGLAIVADTPESADERSAESY